MATLVNRANRSNSGSSAGLASDHSGDDLHLEDDDLDVAEVDLDARELATSGTGAGKDAMQALLASYYGITNEEPAKREEEIDKADFVADSYVRRMLQREGLEALLFRDDELVQDVKRLDSDMQMLVYENYSKFISATDTIRKMKHNVNEMKAEMDSLVRNMEGISTRMHTVNAFLGGKRAKVDKLVAVRRLLKRLEFLFDLPINLTRYVQRQDYGKAVACYKAAIGILRNHAHVPSFKSIQRESDQIISSLKDELQKKLQDPESPSRTLGEHVSLLVDLGLPKQDLQATMLKAYRTKFTKVLNGQQALEEKRAKELASVGWDPTQLPGATSMSAASEEAVSRLNRVFIKDVEEAFSVYRNLFLEANGQGGIKASQSYTDLLDTTKTLFDMYWNILRRIFRTALAVVAQGVRVDRVRDVTTWPLSALQLAADAVKPLHHGMKEANLLEQGSTLVGDVVQGLLFLHFRSLQAQSLKRLLAVYAVLPKLQPGEEALDVGSSGLVSRRDVERVADEIGADLCATLEALQPPIALAETALLAAQASRKAAGGTGANAPGTVVCGLGIKQFSWQFVCWLVDAMERLANVTFRLGENDVVDLPNQEPVTRSPVAVSTSQAVAKRRIFPERFFAHPSSFSTLIADTEDGAAPPPLSFPSLSPCPPLVLVLAVLANETLNRIVPKAADVLGRVYPPRPDGTSSGTSRLSTDDMKACVGGSVGRLACHYVEMQGNHLAAIVQRAVREQQGASAAPLNEATWGRVLLLKLDGLVKEIGTTLGVSIQGVGLAGAATRRDRPDMGRQQGGMVGVGGRKGVHVDIERIFTVRVQVFTPIDLNLEPILIGLLKVALKALIEHVRQTTLSKDAYMQLQVDVQLVRQGMGAFLREGGVIDNLLEEALVSACERCVESLQPSSIDPSAIMAIVTQEYQRLVGGRR